ncbi:acyltransferase family protein [Chitinophagaceae bacterium LWZ2-11]
MYKKIFSDIKAVPEILKPNVLPSLDGFRAISIFIVLISHLNSRWQNQFLIDFCKGKLGVYIFFVISGFLITTLLLKEKISTGNISLKKFYIRRFLRILPVAYLYIAVVILLNYIFNFNIPVLSLLMALLFLQNVYLPNGNDFFVNHYWSLSVEEQFYFIFPSILKKSTKTYIYFIFSALIAIIIIKNISFLPYHKDGSMNSKIIGIFYFLFIHFCGIISQLDGIVIGSLLAILTFKGLIPVHFLIKHKVIISILLLPLIVLVHGVFLLNSPYNTIFSSILIAILIISNITKSNDVVFKFLNNQIVIFLGKLSYSLYIWQQIFTLANARSEKLPWYNSPWNLIGLFATACVSYFLYEKKFLLLKAKFKSN